LACGFVFAKAGAFAWEFGSAKLHAFNGAAACDSQGYRLGVWEYKVHPTPKFRTWS
jgi:hypothetical protein